MQTTLFTSAQPRMQSEYGVVEEQSSEEAVHRYGCVGSDPWIGVSLTRTEPSRILGRGLRALARRLLLEELGEVGGGGAEAQLGAQPRVLQGRPPAAV